MNDLMTADRRERPAEAAAVAVVPAGATMRGAAGGPGRVGRLLSLVRLHLLGQRGPLPSLLGLLLLVGAAGIVSGSIAPVSGFLAGTALVGGLSGVMAERSGINRLLASLPVSRADVVNSYWALAILHLLAASALYAAIGLPLGVHPGKLLVFPSSSSRGRPWEFPCSCTSGLGAVCSSGWFRSLPSGLWACWYPASGRSGISLRGRRREVACFWPWGPVSSSACGC